MEKVVVARLGVEGGGVTLFGHRGEGAWSFWQEGSSMFLDENDDEDWKSWSSEPVADLSRALPDGWLLMHPVEINPSFLPWFRRHYEEQRSKLPEGSRVQQQHRHPHWQGILNG